MDKNASPFETLKEILRHVRNPNELNDHAWTDSLIVREALANTPDLAQAGPGGQLVGALAGLFSQLQPATPPRRGKRLDPHWGEFGLLAALYFVPYNHGTPYPATLQDAYSRIDCAILHFVFGNPSEALGEEQIQEYQLIGADLEYGAPSTLSDWHRKGLQRFTEIILDRERFLARTSSQPSGLLDPEESTSRTGATKPEASRHYKRLLSPKARAAIWLSLTFILLAALGLGLLKARKVYESGLLLYQDAARLQSIARQPVQASTLYRAMPLLESLQGHLALFKAEVHPTLWLSTRLGWVPTYGNDLVSAPALIELAEHSINASLLGAYAVQPLLDELRTPDSQLDPSGLTRLLREAQPELAEARSELDQALAVRKTIAPEQLSPHLRSLILEDLDPAFKLADEGLSLVAVLPSLLGASSDGPKTYLLIAQNEDELRPTGGFITSVGKVVVYHGDVISLDFESVDSDVQEDWTKPYPVAPWQLREYMDSRVLILRDANWFTDFPTTVLWVEYLYAYKHSHSVDGVIAFDQQFLVMLLGELGPLQVEGAPDPIDRENVIAYMRQSKIRPEDAPADWYRKEFIGQLAGAIRSEFSSGQTHDWWRLAALFRRALDERHLLVQFDDPVVSTLTTARGWDNAVRPGGGDYLMVTDTNIGSNKTNAVVDIGLTYDVDLSDLRAPLGSLMVSHLNNASKDVPCLPMTSIGYVDEEFSYPINRSYWNYLRVYKQQGVTLLDSTPQPILGSWMVNKRSIPPRVDDLEEEIPGVQGFGTLQVVRGGQSLGTGFQYALPPGVLTAGPEPNEWSYHLKVQKQPGTLAIPITIRIHLPARAVLKSISTQAVRQEQHLLIETDLRTDVELEVIFSTP